MSLQTVGYTITRNKCQHLEVVLVFVFNV